MASHSTADADAADHRGGGPGRFNVVGRPVSLVLVVGVFVLSGFAYLSGGDQTPYAASGSAALLTAHNQFGLPYAASGSAASLTAIIQFGIAVGLWQGEKWAIVVAVVSTAFGLFIAIATVNFPAVVVGIVLFGTMFAIPRNVWH